MQSAQHAAAGLHQPGALAAPRRSAWSAAILLYIISMHLEGECMGCAEHAPTERTSAIAKRSRISRELIRPTASRTSAAQVIEPAHVDSDTGSVIQTMENITNFIHALHELQFPTSAIFSVPDIESHGWEERRARPFHIRFPAGSVPCREVASRAAGCALSHKDMKVSFILGPCN